MDDLVSRRAAIDTLNGEINITGRANAEAVRGYVRLVKDRLERLPSAQPEIIQCKDCVNHVDRNFCRKANHYTGDGEYCASVFGAERRTDEA